MGDTELKAKLLRPHHAEAAVVTLPSPPPDAIIRPVQHFRIDLPMGTPPTEFSQRLFRFEKLANGALIYSQDMNEANKGEGVIVDRPRGCSTCNDPSQTLFISRFDRTTRLDESTEAVCVECYPSLARRKPPVVAVGPSTALA